MIQETTDYSIFKKHPSNAELIEGNVLRVMRSISTKNLLQHRPILVDSEFRVIDGQHRLEACKRLGIAVFYEQQKSLKTEDMRLLNQSMRIWRRDDFLHHFCEEGKEEYIKLRDFMKKTKLNLDCSLCLLGKSNPGVYGKKVKDVFRDGDFVFPKKEDEQHAIEMLKYTNYYIEIFYNKIHGNKKYLNSTTFKRSMHLFLSCKGVEFDTFIKKSEYKLDLLRSCGKIGDYLQIFQNIYNWKNQAPINVKDII